MLQLAHRSQRINYRLLLVSAMLALMLIGTAQAQTTAFTYQGKLVDNGTPATGSYDLQFKLFDSADFATGNQVGTTLNKLAVAVTAGIFTVELDFGAGVFTGAARFLEIGVRQAGSPNAFTVLSPRQAVTSTPYALHSATAAAADTATNASQLGGLPSSSFIQNTTSQQAGTNFNIGGTGTADILGATTQFNLGGFRILKRGNGSLYAGVNSGSNSTGSGNFFYGDHSGFSNTTGSNNSFFGSNTGFSNTTGSFNAFFGASVGSANTTGEFNSFYGSQAGGNNTTGSSNSFFGRSAGSANTTSNDNSFFGVSAGSSNTTGEFNSFFGKSAGGSNTTSNENAFFGYVAGGLTTTGSSNTFIGSFAGFANTIGSNNTVIGRNANVGANNLTFATAIGAGAVVSTSNTIVLGRSSDTVQIPGTFNITGTLGANVFNATTQFNLNGLRVLSAPGNSNLFAGIDAGNANTTGAFNAFLGNQSGAANVSGEQNAFFGESAGLSNTTGVFNTFIGRAAGGLNTTGSNNIFIGAGATNASTGTQVSNSIVIGVNATVSTSNTILLGTSAQTSQIPGNLIVSAGQGAGSNPAFEIMPSVLGGSVIANNLYIRQFNELPSAAPLCWRVSNAGVAALVMTSCSSSARYKTEVQRFSSGLDLIHRLNPVTFTWKTTSERDVGLIAEEVAEVAPLFTFKNGKGEIEGVKYANLSVLFINAFKEQQAQIKQQQDEIHAQHERINQLEQQIEALKKLFCQTNPQADVCRL